MSPFPPLDSSFAIFTPSSFSPLSASRNAAQSTTEGRGEGGPLCPTTHSLAQQFSDRFTTLESTSRPFVKKRGGGTD